MTALSEWFEDLPQIFTTSAKSQQGVRELQRLIEDATHQVESSNGYAR